MRSQLSVLEIWSGMWARGLAPSLRTVTKARTAMWCSAGRRWTSRSKAVKVTAWRSASSAVGASAILTCGGVVTGPVWVVWPFSSVEREKMTLPAGGLGCSGGVLVWAWNGVVRSRARVAANKKLRGRIDVKMRTSGASAWYFLGVTMYELNPVPFLPVLFIGARFSADGAAPETGKFMNRGLSAFLA